MADFQRNLWYNVPELAIVLKQCKIILVLKKKQKNIIIKETAYGLCKNLSSSSTKF